MGIAYDVFKSAHAKASIGRQAPEGTSHRPDLEITKFGIGAELKCVGSLFLGISISPRDFPPLERENFVWTSGNLQDTQDFFELAAQNKSGSTSDPSRAISTHFHNLRQTKG